MELDSVAGAKAVQSKIAFNGRVGTKREPGSSRCRVPWERGDGMEPPLQACQHRLVRRSRVDKAKGTCIVAQRDPRTYCNGNRCLVGEETTLGSQGYEVEEELLQQIDTLRAQNRALFESAQESAARYSRLEQRVKILKKSMTWHLTKPLRHIERYFQRLLQSRTEEPVSPQAGLNVGASELRLGPESGRIALIVDYRWPRPDEDSGSIDAINLIEALIELSFTVVFHADAESGETNRYRSALEDRGVFCLGAPRSVDLLPFLQAHGGSVHVAVLSRVYAGGAHRQAVRVYCPGAPIIFNTVDLQFRREEKVAQLSGSAESLAAAARTRELELMTVRRADATIVVSTVERDLLKQLLPAARVHYLPLARPVVLPRTSFQMRRNIGFVGGSEHSPNVDALRYFLAEVWPLVRKLLPDCEFSVVGRGQDTAELACGHTADGVRYLGHLPDLNAWFETIRVSVAPLRIGAGAKGKIASSLACGVPCVTTQIGAEGMDLSGERVVLIADNPAEFAECVRRAYADASTWDRMSKAGLAYAHRTLSVAAFKRRLADLLEEVGVDARASRGQTPKAAATAVRI